MRPIPLKLSDYFAGGRAALVLWDLQNGLAGRSPDVEKVRTNALRLIEAAEAAGAPVAWSRHILPPLEQTAGPFLLFLMRKQKVDHPSKLKATMQRGMEDTEFLPGLEPAPHHLVIEKSQPSFFVDTPLALRLKTLDVDTIVLAGVATDIGIEFTARHAAALGIYSVVAEDATASYTDAAHQRSLDFLRGWTTPVVPTADICAEWQKHRKEQPRG